MLQANITARSGIIAQQERIDVIANNMANVNTYGYKSVRADFKDMLYQTMVRPEQPQDGLNLEKGHGTMLGATVRDFSQGAIQNTGNPLDMLIVGDAFFAVQDPDGNTLYTRDGKFALSEENGSNYLVTVDGMYVLDSSGNKINLQTGNSIKDVKVDTQGRITVVTETGDVSVGKFGLYTFKNRQGLEAASSNCFRETDNSGQATAWSEEEADIRQGMLESSNVDLAAEMTRLIRAQRAFSLATRALTTADEMDAKANQLRT